MEKKYMNKMKKVFLFLLCLAMSETIESQTVNWKITPCWDSVDILSNNMLRVEKSGKWGIVSFSGAQLFQFENVKITDICEGRFLLLGENSRIISIVDEKGNLFPLKNKKGKLLADNLFVDPAWPYFSEGMLAVRNSEGKWGFLNTLGQLVIKNKYLKAYPFRYGQSAVKNNKYNWYHIDKGGHAVPIDRGLGHSQREFISSYTKIGTRPMSIVCTKEKMCLIDAAGNIQDDIVPKDGISYTYSLFSENDSTITYSLDDFSIVFNNRGEMSEIRVDKKHYHCEQKEYPPKDKTYFSPTGIEFDQKGRIHIDSLIICPQFQEVTPLTNDIILVKKENKWGMLEINRNNETIKFNLAKPFQKRQTTDLEFGLSTTNTMENMKAYICDQDGLTFFEITDGKFTVPIKHLDKNNQITIGLEENGVLLEPIVLSMSEKTTDISKFRISWYPSKAIPVKPHGNATITVTIKKKEDDSASFRASVFKDGRDMKTPIDGLIKLTKKINNIRFKDGGDFSSQVVTIYVQEEGCTMESVSHRIQFEKKY